MLCCTFIVLALLAGGSQGSVVGGRRTYINYNSDCGVWNDPIARRGHILEECCPVDMSFPGSPWQQLSVSYSQDSGSVVSNFGGNTAGGCSGPNGYTVLSERVLDDASGLVGIEHVFSMGLLTVTKTETWDFDGQIVRIRFKVKYSKGSYLANCKPIEKLSLMHAVDPDQDWEPFGVFPTLNDVIYPGGSGLFAEATGPRSCKTFGYGICTTKNDDGSQEEVGFGPWTSTTPTTLKDPNGQMADETLHYQHQEVRPLYCGDEREFGFFAVWGRCFDDARRNFIHGFSQFCEKCAKLPKLPPTLIPRCRAHCPCSLANCTCNYECREGPTFTAADVTAAVDSLTKIEAKCDGTESRTKRESIVFDPFAANVDAMEISEDICKAAKENLSKRRR